jgi:hypothetical protein
MNCSLNSHSRLNRWVVGLRMRVGTPLPEEIRSGIFSCLFPKKAYNLAVLNKNVLTRAGQDSIRLAGIVFITNQGISNSVRPLLNYLCVCCLIQEKKGGETL